MGKSILILDTPERCGDCPFMDGGCIDEYCSAHGGDCIDIPDVTGGKPEWCPLRPLPEPKSEEFGQTIIASARAEGWNNFLYTITKDLTVSKMEMVGDLKGED